MSGFRGQFNGMNNQVQNECIEGSPRIELNIELVVVVVDITGLLDRRDSLDMKGFEMVATKNECRGPNEFGRVLHRDK